ncbi:hypothetical protein ANO14919_086420 [Xylariales sp. No.14919]|nr:hypothetical protein ANO14919_086420 [Xylariales sp. No.14919]
MSRYSLKGKTAVVTGAARGLGLVFAQGLAEAGANIAVLDIGTPGSNVEDLATKYSVRASFYKVDVTNRSQVYETVEQIEKEFGSVDINVNAAGIATDESFLTTSDKNLNATMSFVGSFLVAQACAHAMVRNRERSGPVASGEETSNGSIIFIASILSHMSTAVQNLSVYSASKAAVRGLVKPMAMELAPYGIRVNSISPGPMKTVMYEAASAVSPAFANQMEKETMFGRVGIPEELKGAVLFLCSQMSSWTTGQDLLCDGGASSYKHLAAVQ